MLPFHIRDLDIRELHPTTVNLIDNLDDDLENHCIIHLIPVC